MQTVCGGNLRELVNYSREDNHSIRGYLKNAIFQLLLLCSFQNSITVGDIELKSGMVIVFGRLGDPMIGFLPESVHKCRHGKKKTEDGIDL